jgi:hypothetical protein
MKMECVYCGEEKDFLIKTPVTVVKTKETGESTFLREGYNKDMTPDNICFECLKEEAEEIFKK